MQEPSPSPLPSARRRWERWQTAAAYALLVDLRDTIVAVASTPGVASRAVVRLSGPGAHAALKAIVAIAPPRASRPRDDPRRFPRCRAVRLALAPGPSVPTGTAAGAGVTRGATARLTALTLPALVIEWCAPRSSTGEDALEILIPGNRALADRVVASLLSALPREGDVGAIRLAGPGEFTARAFLHGKIDAQQAEGVALTIAARDGEQLAAARALTSGTSGARFRVWTEETAALLALVEAGIDFTDQEGVVAIAPDALRDRLGALASAIRAELGDAPPREARTDATRAALVGPPNAGKSALFNALLGRPRCAPRAIVSDAPGTTRDALAEPLEPGERSPIPPPPVTLVDLAGLDEALASRGAVDALAQRRALEEIAAADVLIVCDPLGRFETLERADVAAAIRARHTAPRVLRVRTKADLAPPNPATPGTSGETGATRTPASNPSPPRGEGSRRPDATERGPVAAPLAVCALDGWGVASLRRAIFDAALADAPLASGARFVLPRHRAALASTLDSVNHSLALAARTNGAAELVALRLRAALDSLGEISGAVSPDDVLGRIFASFCIGK